MRSDGAGTPLLFDAPVLIRSSAPVWHVAAMPDMPLGPLRSKNRARKLFFSTRLPCRGRLGPTANYPAKKANTEEKRKQGACGNGRDCRLCPK